MKFLNAIGFLTIIKIPEKAYLKKEDYPGMLVYFPIVGLIVGLICAAFFTALNFFLPLILAVILTVGLEIILTGGIHIDGLADSFDGVFSGESDRDKIRLIMKKGDVGVFGVLAILFALALKITLLYLICRALGMGENYAIFLDGFPMAPGFFLKGIKYAMPGFTVFLSISVFAPVFGRLSMLGQFARHKISDTKQSLATAFFDKSNMEVYGLSCFYLTILFISVSIFSQLYYLEFSNMRFFISNFGPGTAIALIAIKSVIVAIVTLFFAQGMGKFLTKKTGSLGGDVLGGTSVLTEVFFLLFCYISIKFL